MAAISSHSAITSLLPIPSSKLRPSKSLSIKPSSLKPSSLKPSSLKPSSLKPCSLKPSSLKPSSLKPCSLKPSSLKPCSLKPSSLKPISAKSSSNLESSPNQTLKSRLHSNGEPLYGLFILSFSPTLAEIAGLSGYDFVVIDMEHGHGGISEALHCLHALSATQTPTILRLPENSPTWAKKALDLGPHGLMFPMIQSPKDASNAVSYTKFPPHGIRGSAHPIVRASKYGFNEGYLSEYEDELVIMCQVESEKGVKKIEEIAGVEGVDCVQMGPLDLSASMGFLWDPGNKKVMEMMRRAEKGVLESKACLGGFAMPHDGPKEMKKRGYKMISGAVDLGLFRKAAVEDVNRFKMNGMDQSEEDETHDHKDGDEDDKYWSE